VRADTGKGAARRLRREGLLPAIIYGGDAEPVMVTLAHHKVLKNLESDAIYSHILTVKVDGKDETTILKGIHRHPSKPIIMHMDFLRINQNEAIRVHVPLHFMSEDISAGVKQGGVVTHHLVDVEVSCLPAQLPEFIAVDIAELDIGDSLHLSDLIVPEGIEIVALSQGDDHNAVVVAIQASRAAASEDDNDNAEETTETGEPE
jgi:large subunit ribosomal protein L25